jgi:hypothetical protein
LVLFANQNRTFGPYLAANVQDPVPQSSTFCPYSQPRHHETNRTHSILFAIQTRTFVPYLAAIPRILIPVMGRWTGRWPGKHGRTDTADRQADGRASMDGQTDMTDRCVDATGTCTCQRWSRQRNCHKWDIHCGMQTPCGTRRLLCVNATCSCSFYFMLVSSLKREEFFKSCSILSKIYRGLRLF